MKKKVMEEYRAEFIGLDSDQWARIGLLILIIVVIIVVLGLGVHYLSFNQSRFTITQEVCWNETYWTGWIKFNDIPNVSTNYFCDLPSKMCKFLITKQVCEKKEVEMPIYTDCEPSHYNAKDFPKECRDYASCTFSCRSVTSNYFPIFKDDPEKFDLNSCYERCRDKNLKKIKITEEWLNDNCECSSDWCDYELYRKPLCYNSKEDSWKDRDRIDHLICSRYKCGQNYEVVKNG